MQNLSKTNLTLLYIIIGILLSRLLAMFIIPFTDTTEARYAEMARIMVETNDWVTPYINYDIPFWGKPPFSFWVQALSFKVFGINEFAPRFPSWLATIAITALLFRLLSSIYNQTAATLASLIFVSCMLVFALSGAVLTDPFLALSVTLSLVSFMMLRHHKKGHWGYWFFVGIALGLLAKGPIAVVLIAGPIGLWLLLAKHRWASLKLLPWFSGVLLCAALTLPWYIIAELKTPGFLEYFILGEHFYRFVDPGWAGDLYGTAHKQPKGTIWFLWLAASLPWGLIAIASILKHVFKKTSRPILKQQLKQDDSSFLILWALFTMMFFTLSGNVLWTYALPALPALAILLALYFSQHKNINSVFFIRTLIATSLLIPALTLALTFYGQQHPEMLPTEKYMVEHYQSVASENDELFFINERSFSARYYSSGKAKLINIEELKALLNDNTEKSFFLAMPKEYKKAVSSQIDVSMNSLFESNKFILYSVKKL